MNDGPLTERGSLNASPRLRFAEAACLSIRFPDYACGSCQEACPTGAIALADGVPGLVDECIGCGRCAAVCPTAAITADGFAAPASPDPAATEVCIDCWRVPFDASPAGTLRVPCLGGLSAGWLIALAERAGDRPIHLLDRGGCADCRAGATMTEWVAAVTEARIRLHQAGQPLDALPVISHLPAPQRLAPSIPAADAEIRMGRRTFFRNLLGSMSRSAEALTESGNGEGEAVVLREPAAPLDRLRAVTALAAIARRHGRELPGEILPQIRLGECSGHGICARICPTQALQREEAADTAELRFFAARCIACGQCARLCPDGAIRVEPEGGHSMFEVLARWKARSCRSCGQVVYETGDDLCQVCRKSQRLMQGVAAMFGPHV